MIKEKFFPTNTALFTLISACLIVAIFMGLRMVFGLFTDFFVKDLQCTITEFGLAIGIQMLNNVIDFKSEIRKFDIIFLDPPYKDKNLQKILLNISREKLIDKNTIIIIHRHKKEIDLYPENFNVLDKKSYGISKVIFGILN